MTALRFSGSMTHTAMEMICRRFRCSDAATSDEAAAIASDDETLFEWEQVSVAHFDARVFVALDENGEEIEATQRGDF